MRALAVDRLRRTLGAPEKHLAEAIESGIMRARPTARGYKAQVRAVVHILTAEPMQPGSLRQRLCDGSVPAERVGALRPDQLQCDAKRASAAALRDGGGAGARELLRMTAPEGCHQCPRCGDRRTVHTCAQTRCGDEPMTVFVTCLQCDNHFRG